MTFAARPLVWLLATALLVSVPTFVGSAGAEQPTAENTAGPPADPGCLSLGAGTTGILYVGGSVPSPDQVQGRPGGFGDVASDAVPLPTRIRFKSERETFSNEYAFVLRAGKIYVRRAEEGTPLPNTRWRVLELPDCLAGRVEAISADHRLLVALGPDGQLYSHDMPGGDLSAERWTWRWGPYLWLGSGMTMFSDVRRYATSEFNSTETFTDTSGRRQHPIGVATVYLLRGDRRTITYLDPWLPQDASREVCGPKRGTLPLANIDASGSVVLAVARDGRLFTRLYDFDVSGANPVYGSYSWQRNRPESDTAWQLPIPDWSAHSRPPGTITDRITIAKTGPDAKDRELRVEGRRNGSTGSWHKAITAKAWAFTRTRNRLVGGVLPDSSKRFAPADLRFAGAIDGADAVIENFNAACSPARMVVRVAEGVTLPLVVHSYDAIRQVARGPGLDDVPRDYNGAVEVPRRVWRGQRGADPRLTAWIDRHLTGRMTESGLTVTATRLRFTDLCWELTLNGDPAHPDAISPEPDFGVVLGTLLGFTKDPAPPTVC